MKKSCTIIGAMAFACFAMPAAAGMRSQLAPGATVANPRQMTVCDMPAIAGISADKAAGFTKIEDLAGEYDATYTGLLNGSDGPQTDSWVVTVTDAAKGEVEVRFHPMFESFKAIVDLSANTFSIPSKQKLGEDEDGSIYLYFKDPDMNTGMLIDGASATDPLVGTISGTTITFPDFAVFALGDYDNELLGWYFLGYSVKMARVGNQDNPNEGWSDFGTAMFTDGWICPGYDLTGDDATWKVKVQRNDDDKKLFRLDNPYAVQGNPLAEMADVKGGYIVFSIENPDFVEIVDNVYSGVMMNGFKIHMTNVEGFYLAQGAPIEEIKTNIPEITTWSTYKDKVVDIPNARFTTGDGRCYAWSDTNNQSLAHLMKSKIVFDNDPEGDSGVASLEEDDDAPVEYYTIQGVRVADPEKGMLVIRRQGSKVCKTVIR